MSNPEQLPAPAPGPAPGGDERPLPTLAPSRFRDRELWVGIFVILGVAAILTALFTLTDVTLFRGRYTARTIVPDAGGIRRGDPVQMLGVNIGTVSSFRIKPGGVEVELDIERRYAIPADSRVELRSSGLLGGMVANVIPGTSSEKARGGQVLPGATAKGTFDQLQDSAERALGQVQKLLDEQTLRNVHEGSAELRAMLRQLDALATEQRGQISALSTSLRRTANALEQAATGPELERSLKRIDLATARLDSISSALDRSSRSAASILARVDRGEGSLGKLTRDEELYNNAADAAATLKKTAEEFERLAADVRANPKKYLKLSLF